MREWSKKYYQENKEQIKELQKKYRQENKEEKRAYDKKYYQENKELKKENARKHYQEHKEYYKRYFDMRYRELGFNPLNEPFEGAHGHHINKIDVIYMPKELHRSVYHNVFTGQGMDAINKKALAYLKSVGNYDTISTDYHTDAQIRILEYLLG